MLWAILMTAGAITVAIVALLFLTVFIEAMAEPEDQFDTFFDKPER